MPEGFQEISNQDDSRYELLAPYYFMEYNNLLQDSPERRQASLSRNVRMSLPRFSAFGKKPLKETV